MHSLAFVHLCSAVIFMVRPPRVSANVNGEVHAVVPSTLGIVANDGVDGMVAWLAVSSWTGDAATASGVEATWIASAVVRSNAVGELAQCTLNREKRRHIRSWQSRSEWGE
jgi:hypothetical protein